MRNKYIILVSLLILVMMLSFSLWRKDNNRYSYHEFLETIVGDWLTQNTRLSRDAIITINNRNLTISLEEASEVGSPVIENISSINLAYNIYKADSASIKKHYDILNIAILLDSSLVEIRNSEENVIANNKYTFTLNRLRGMIKNLSSLEALSVSNYITFKITNKEETDFFQADHYAKKIFKWYDYDKGGLNLLYEYSILKNSNSSFKKDEDHIKHLEYEILALYKLFEKAEFESIKHFNALLKINNLTLPNVTLEDLVDNPHEY